MATNTLHTKSRKVDDYTIEVNSDGTCVITDYTGREAILVVPGILDGCVVTGIGGYAFSDRVFLTSITLTDGMTSIGENAFNGCTFLTSITLPDSVTSIGNSAFIDCDSLISITLPDNVTSIGDYAFFDCDSLTSITLPASVTRIGDIPFSSCLRLILRVPRDSYAATYAQENDIPFEYID